MRARQQKIRNQHERDLCSRTSKLFSQGNEKYALNGGSALNMVHTRGRIPADIDLRCDDIERVRRAFADRFESIPPKHTSVQVYCFVDDNGIVIDLSQNIFERKKMELPARPIGFANEKPVRVITYGFEELLAEKLIALSRKADAKDSYDICASLALPVDRGKVLRMIEGMAVAENADPLRILRPDFSIRMNTAPDIAKPSGQPDMLESVRIFLKSLIC